MRPIAGVNPSGFAAASLVVAVLGWVGLTWSFADIFVTLGQLAENTGDAIIDVSVLSPASAAYHRLYGAAYAVLSFLIGVVFWVVSRLGSADDRSWFARLMRGTLAIVFGVTLFTAVLPYRLFWRNESERVSFNRHRTYVLGRTENEVLLYLPDATDVSHVIVAGKDERINRGPDRFVESIFSPP